MNRSSVLDLFLKTASKLKKNSDRNLWVSIRSSIIYIAVAAVAIVGQCSTVRGGVVLIEDIVGVTRLAIPLAENERHFWPQDDPPPPPVLDFQIGSGDRTAEIHAEFDQVDGQLLSMAASGRSTNLNADPLVTISTFSPSFRITDEPVSVLVDWNGTVEAASNYLNLALTTRPSDDLADPTHPIPLMSFRDQAPSSSAEFRETLVLTPGDYKLTAQSEDNASFDIAIRFGAALWREAVSGNFGDMDRWVGNVVPMSDDQSFFNADDSPYTVTFDQPHMTRGATVSRGDVTFDLGNNRYDVDELNVTAAMEESTSLSITGSAGSRRFDADAVNVTGGNHASVDIAAESRFGSVVLNGGMSISGDNDLAIGPGFIFGEEGDDPGVLSVGRDGEGELVVGQGASLFLFSETVIGEITEDSMGRVEVFGTLKTVLPVTVGRTARGELNITPGAEASFAAGLTIGELGSPEAIVRIQDGVEIDELLSVGESGHGTLSVSDTGIVESTEQGRLAVNVGQTGTIEVSLLALISAHELNVGVEPVSGEALVRIANNSGVTVSAETDQAGVNGVARVGVGGAGRVIVDGSSPGLVQPTFFQVDNELTVGGQGVIEVIGDGAVVVGRPTMRSDEGFITVAGGRLSGVGTLIGTLRVTGGANIFGGTLAPGSSPGTLTVVGDLDHQVGGLLEMEIAGTANGEFDQLIVTGDADIDGTVLLKFIGGFAPSQGDTFSIFDVGGTLTTGPNVNYVVQNLARSFEFDISLENGGLTLVALNDATFVPEPTAYALLTAGALVVIVRRSKRTSRRVPWPPGMYHRSA